MQIPSAPASVTANCPGRYCGSLPLEPSPALARPAPAVAIMARPPPGMSMTLSAARGSAGAPASLRARLLFTAAAATAAAAARALRRSPAKSLRRRLVRRLDRVAPVATRGSEPPVNDACPVCLTEFADAPDRPLRVQTDCQHGACAECLEAWVLHTTCAHLNPARFGLTRNGDIVSWHGPPCCPMCRAKIAVIEEADIRDAVIAAISLQGGALATFNSSAPDIFTAPTVFS